MGTEAATTSHVAKLRLQRGWTQQQLANIVRVSRQTIIAIEKGNYEPSTSLALKLALALDARVEDLFMLAPSVIAQVQGALAEDGRRGNQGEREGEGESEGIE